jgi:hypothetical protein
MSAKSDRKKAIKDEKLATYGFPSAWQQFKNQPQEDRTEARIEAHTELRTALQTIIRHGSPVFTPRRTTERG